MSSRISNVVGAKVGDELILKAPHPSTWESLVVVDRVTATQIVIGEHRYSRDNGRRRGQPTVMGRYRILRGTDERHALLRRSGLESLTQELLVKAVGCLSESELKRIQVMCETAISSDEVNDGE